MDGYKRYLKTRLDVLRELERHAYEASEYTRPDGGAEFWARVGDWLGGQADHEETKIAQLDIKPPKKG